MGREETKMITPVLQDALLPRNFPDALRHLW